MPRNFLVATIVMTMVALAGVAALPQEPSPGTVEAGLEQASGEAQRSAGMAAYKQRDYAKAVPLLVSAHALFPQDLELMGRLGYAYKEIGDYEKAREILLEATILEPENHQHWWWLSDTQRLLGRYEASRESMQTACALAPKAEAETFAQRLAYTEALLDESRSWDNFETHRGFAKRHDAMRRLWRGIAEYESALEVAPEILEGTTEGQLQLGWVHQKLGTQYSYLKEFDLSIHCFHQAVRRYELAESPENAMRSIQNLALAYGAMAVLGGENREALLEESLGYWERTLTMAREQKDVEYTRYAQGAMLANLVALYPVDDARVQAMREKNLPELPWSGPINEYTVANVALGELACRLEEGDFAGARIVLEMTLPFYEQSEYRSNQERAADLCGSLAYVYCRQGHFEKALEVAEKGVALLASIRGFLDSDAFNRGAEGMLRRRLCAAQVRACIGLGDDARALGHLEGLQAEDVQGLLGGVIQDEAAAADRVTEAELLRRRIRSLEETLAAGGPEELQRLEERLGKDRARLAWLERNITFGGPETLEYTTVPLQEAAAVQAALPADVALLSYVLDPWGGFAVVVTHDGVVGVPLEDAREETVRTLVRSFLQNLPKDADAAAEYAETLFGLLVAPVWPHLDCQVLYVATDGVLRGVPFEALSEDGTPLAEDFAVVYIPSGSHLVHCLNAEPPARKTVRTLLRREGTERIPGIEGACYVGQEATESRAKQGIAKGEALHIVCAADFALADSMLGALLLTGDEDDDGRLHAAEFLALSLPSAFVLLDVDAASGPHGGAIAAFAEALRHAGTPALLMNLWSPGEAAAHALTAAFHEHLSTMDPAKALSAAKRTMRRTQPNNYDWAAFVLHGDYR